MDFLFLLQFGCLIITFLLALLLAVSRIHIVYKNRRYEQSRWMLCVAMSILALHYLLQMVFGFRAQGDDVGAVINILFYVPVSFLMSLSVLNVSLGYRTLRRFFILCPTCYLIILANFAIGYYVYGSLHMKHTLYVMNVLYFVSMLFSVISPSREILRFRNNVIRNTGGDLSNYNIFTIVGYIVMCILSVASAFIFYSRVLLAVVGISFLISVFVYIVSFVCLGFTLQNVASVLDAEDSDSGKSSNSQNAIDDFHKITPAKATEIETAIEHWKNEKGFRDSGISINILAQRINVPQTVFSHYLAQYQGLTFRIWLSKLRVEEAKKLILEHPNYSNEAIAAECGFASRTYFQNVFKENTGYTPKEWSIRQS